LKNLINKLENHHFKIKKCIVLFSYEWLFVRWLNLFIKYFFKSDKRIQYKKTSRGKFDILLLAKVKNKI
jgi:hypothetical protein